MQLGLVGLGRMGGNMRDRLRAAGHEVVGFDHHPDSHRRREPGRAGQQAGRAAGGLDDGSGRQSPKTRSTSSPSCSPRATSSSTVATRGSAMTARVPSGSAQGHRLPGRRRLRWRLGHTNGYALMVGGDAEHVAQVPADLRRAQAGRRVRLRARRPVGAGHYSKMVHNGIEYGLMHAYAEGYEILKAAELVTTSPPSSRAGGRAASSSRGCSTCWTGPSTRTRSWPTSAVTPTTPARAAGRSTRPCVSPYRPTSSPRRCSLGSPPGRRTRRQ